MTAALPVPPTEDSSPMRSPPVAPTPSLRQTLRGAACLAAQPLLLNLLSVPALAYIIRRLGPEGYAHWMAAVALIAICAVITNPGLRGAFVRHLAAHPEAAASALAEQLGLRLMLTMLAGSVLACITVIVGYPAAILWCIAVGTLGLALTTIATTFADLLQSFHRIRTLAAVNLAAGLTLTAASVVAAHWIATPVAIALAYLTGPVVSAAVLMSIVQRKICPVRVRLDIRQCGRLLARARFFAAQQLLSVGSNQAEAVMLPLMIRMSQFGFFTAGAMIPSRLSALPDALCTAAYPGLVKASAAGPSRAGRLVLLYLAIAAVGGVLVAAAGALLARPIGQLLFPLDLGPFASIVQITIWCLPLVGVELVLSYALNAAGKDAAVARASVPAAAASLLTTIALVSALGITGACWSMLLRPGIRVIFLAPVAWRTFRPAAVPAVVQELTLAPVSLLRKAG